jgi:hypothetical protein
VPFTKHEQIALAYTNPAFLGGRIQLQDDMLALQAAGNESGLDLLVSDYLRTFRDTIERNTPLGSQVPTVVNEFVDARVTYSVLNDSAARQLRNLVPEQDGAAATSAALARTIKDVNRRATLASMVTAMPAEKRWSLISMASQKPEMLLLYEDARLHT